MKVSVCMATYNGARFIEEQLQTILSQTRQPDEVIICDDCSTDETAKVVSEFIARNRLEERNWRLIQNTENKGYPGNFYYAMEQCRGDMVFLADQDDLWETCKIEVMEEALANNRDCGMVACKFGIIDSEDKQIHTMMNPSHSRESAKLRKVSVEDILRKYEWPGMVLAYNNEWKNCRFSEIKEENKYKSIQHDMLLCLMAAEQNAFLQIDRVLSYHRRHENNTAKEEHRISKLLNKERKLGEIDAYIKMMKGLIDADVTRIREIKFKLNNKIEVMKDRKTAIEKGKLAVLKNAWKHRRDTRAVTWICDIWIA